MPVMPIEDILAFIIVSFDGIIRDVTLSKCYLEKVCQNQVLFLMRKAWFTVYILAPCLCWEKSE